MENYEKHFFYIHDQALDSNAVPVPHGSLVLFWTVQTTPPSYKIKLQFHLALSPIFVCILLFYYKDNVHSF